MNDDELLLAEIDRLTASDLELELESDGDGYASDSQRLLLNSHAYYSSDDDCAGSVDQAMADAGGNGRFQARFFVLTLLVQLTNAAHVMSMTFTNVELPCAADPAEQQDDASTIASAFGLVCGRAVYVATTGSVFFLGFLIGAGVFGALADRAGRRRTLFVAVLVCNACAALSAAASGLQAYMLLRLLVGAGAGGTGVVGFVLLSELFVGEMRSHVGILFSAMFSVGALLTSAEAWLLQDWRALTLALALPGGTLLLAWGWVPESPRWLAARGQPQAAARIVARIAAYNGRPPPAVALEPPRGRTRSASGAGGAAGGGGPPRLSILHPVLRQRTLVMLAAWFANSFVYYGLTLNAGNMGGSLYINSALLVLLEFPSYLFVLWSMSQASLGRRGSVCALMLLAGACISISGGLPQCPDDQPDCGYARMRTYLALVGKFGIAGSFAVVYVYAAELFPTVVRNAAVGMCSLAARVGGILAPQVVHLAAVSWRLPLILFGFVALVAAVMVLALPETLGQPLVETLDGAQKQKGGYARVSASEESDSEASDWE